MFYRLVNTKSVESFETLPIFHPDIMATIIESEVIPTNNDSWNGIQFIQDFTDSELLQTEYDLLIKNILLQISNKFDTDIKPVTDGYSVYEIDSWSIQESEARSIKAGTSNATPLLDNMAFTSNKTKDQIADNIIIKADNYYIIFGEALGKKQKLKDDVSVIVDSIDNIATKIENLNTIII